MPDIRKRQFRLLMKVRRRILCSDGKSWTSESTGRVVYGDCVVEVDLEKVAEEIGRKAIMSSGGKSKYMNGAVVVRRVGERPVILEG